MRLAKCCRPVPGDEIAGYVSLGRGITIHRDDCKNVKALKKAPERFVEVGWEGENEASYRVELQIDAYDRTRLLEDLSRTFSEAGINIIGATCTTNHPMVKNKFVIEVGDTEQLKHCISRLRNVESRLRRLPHNAGAPDRGGRGRPMALTVAVTGPTGEIGLPLLDALERDPAGRRGAGDGAAAVRPGAEGWEKVSYRRGDILDRGSLAALFDGADVAVHLAFAIFGGREETRRINLEGSRNVFEVAVAAGVRRLVYASSVAAYGFHPENPQPLDRGGPGARQRRLLLLGPEGRAGGDPERGGGRLARSTPTSSAPASSPARGRRC